MLDWVWFALNTSSRGYEIVQALSCIQKCAGKGGQRGRWFWISTRSLYGGEHQIEKFVFEYNYGSGGGMHPYGSH